MKEMQKGQKMNENKRLMRIGALILMIAILLTVGGIIYFEYEAGNMGKGAENEQEDSVYDAYYVMIVEEPTSDFWVNAYESAKETAKENNICVDLMGALLKENYTTAELMKMAIAAEVDGIIVEGNESEEMSSLINEAIEKDIPVVTLMTDNGESNRTSYIGIGGYNVGNEYGEQIKSIYQTQIDDFTEEELAEKEKWNVCVLVDSETENKSQNILLSGIQDSIGLIDDETLPIDVYQYVVNNESSFSMEESIRTLLLDEANLPEVIICSDAEQTWCVYQSIVDFNMVGKLEIIGGDDSDTTLTAISRNVIYSTISVNASELGEKGVEALNEYRKTGYVSEYYAVDIQIITEENVASFLEEEDHEE